MDKSNPCVSYDGSAPSLDAAGQKFGVLLSVTNKCKKSKKTITIIAVCVVGMHGFAFLLYIFSVVFYFFFKQSYFPVKVLPLFLYFLKCCVFLVGSAFITLLIVGMLIYMHKKGKLRALRTMILADDA